MPQGIRLPVRVTAYDVLLPAAIAMTSCKSSGTVDCLCVLLPQATTLLVEVNANEWSEPAATDMTG